MKSLYLLCLTALALASQVEAKPISKFHRRDGDKVSCRNYKTDFSEGLDGWVAAYAPDNTYKQTDRGLEMNLIRPNEYKNPKNYKSLDGGEDGRLHRKSCHYFKITQHPIVL